MTESIGIDVGGTFTDLVGVREDGSVRTGKVLSTPSDQSEGVERSLRERGADAANVVRIVHGTTVVTNMLLERRGSKVVLCATAGATDLLELRRQERASLYDLSAQHPEPLVPAEHAALDTPLEIEVTVEHRRKRAEARVVCTPFFNPERKRA